MKKVKSAVLTAGIFLCSILADAQETKTSELQYQLVKELNAAHKMLVVSLSYTDYVKQRMFVREANSSIANGYAIFLKLKPTLSQKLTSKEMDDLEGCFIFIQNMTLKDDFTPNDPMKIGLWAGLADAKLQTMLPKVMR